MSGTHYMGRTAFNGFYTGVHWKTKKMLFINVFKNEPILKEFFKNYFGYNTCEKYVRHYFCCHNRRKCKPPKLPQICIYLLCIIQ